MYNVRFITLSSMIFIAAIMRLLPHPPNFTPIAAMALFGGAYFADRRLSFLLPLAAMFMSNIILGYYTLMPVVYGTFALIVIIGFYLRNNVKISTLTIASFSGALTFFIITNFAVWLFSGMYPMTTQGLIACYAAALPFFKNTLLSTLFYSALMFGAFEMAKFKFPVLVEDKS